MLLLWTAFLMGLAGSMHCMVMCGPLVLSLPGRAQLSSLARSRVLYNLGRLGAYVVIGMVFGLLGKVLGLLAYQQWLSVVSGIILLLAVLPAIIGVQRGPFVGAFRVWSKVSSRLFGFVRAYKGPAATVGMGVVNGFLPCGLVYVAAAASLHAGSFSYSILYMLLFGAGTLPVMLGLGLFGNWIKLKSRLALQKAVPYLAIGMAVLFILRGLALDIPYLSPKITQSATGQVHSCCSHCKR